MDKSQLPRLSAGRRITLVFAASALAGIALVGAALMYSIERAALAQSRTYLESRAGMLARQCESEIAEAQRDLEFMSKMPAFQQLPYVDLIDPAINGAPENVDVEKRQFLTQTLKKAERFSVLYVLRPNADIYVLEPFKLQPQLSKRNLADRPYYQEAVRTKRVVVSDSFIGADGVLAVVILAPIVAESGDVTGYLGGAFHLTRLSQLVSKEGISPFDAGFMVDRKGYLIAHTDVGLLKEGVRERFAQHPLVSGFLSSEGDAAEKGQGAIFLDDCVDPTDAKHYLAAFVPLRSGWGLALLRDRDSVVGEVQPVIWGITGLAALLFLVVSGIGVAIAQRIGKRWEAAERALRASEADLRTTLASIGDGVISTDTQRRISRLNDAAALLTGWKDQEAVGRPLDEVFRIVNEETRESAPDPVGRVLASGRIEGLANHSVLIARDGAERAIADSAAPIHDPAGDITGVVLVFLDVSEERRAAESLRESEEKYRMLSDFTWDWIYWLDNEYHFVYSSPSCEWITGYTAEEFIADPSLLLRIIHPEDRALFDEHRKTYSSSPDHGEAEFRIIRRDGSMRWIGHVCRPIIAPDGLCLGRRNGNRDITDRKQAEERLKGVLADLERSNKELEQFAYVASHDLQEPLRMVSSYTQLLAERYEGQLDEKAKKYIDYAVDGAIRMQRLINDLLTYSRVGTRGNPLQPTDSHAVLGEALRNLAATIEENRAIIVNDDLPTVRADASQLTQVFQNLIANAIKFRSEDLPRIHVSAREQAGEWVFSVADNGIGIDPQYADRLFVIFQRLHTRDEYPGTGIGLAVCRRIAERHGGRIWFESELGKGSTFYFTIPK